MNLFRPGLRDSFFDFVISNGVLHHTNDARRAFARISRLAKPGGYVLVGLYHAYSRQLHYARRALFRLTGVTSRVLDPHFGRVAAEGKREAWFQDQYCHPHESCHTFGEVFSWLEENNLEFVNAIPKPAGGPQLTPDERHLRAKGSRHGGKPRLESAVFIIERLSRRRLFYRHWSSPLTVSESCAIMSSVSPAALNHDLRSAEVPAYCEEAD